MTDRVCGHRVFERWLLRGAALLAAALWTTGLGLAAELAIVGPARGVVATKLGMATHVTRYSLENGFAGLKKGLKEQEFFTAIENRGKRTDTMLLSNSVSKKRILKTIKKESKEIRKDHEEIYTKKDTKILLEFIESLDLKGRYARGTRFVVESGKGDRPPVYSVFDPNGRQLTRKEVTDATHAGTLRKFLNYQPHWFRHYQRAGRRR